MKKRLTMLILGTAIFWALAALAARLVWGGNALGYSATAAGLCLLPTLVTLVWSGWALTQSAEQQLVMVLGGTGVRIFAVLLGGWCLYACVPYYRQEFGYWFWILLFYLYTLALDVILMIQGMPASVPASSPTVASAPQTKDREVHGA